MKLNKLLITELLNLNIQSIRSTNNTSTVSKWLHSSREIRHHIDDFRCSSEPVGELTALHLACLYNRPHVIKLLLQAGAGEQEIGIATIPACFLFVVCY